MERIGNNHRCKRQARKNGAAIAHAAHGLIIWPARSDPLPGRGRAATPNLARERECATVRAGPFYERTALPHARSSFPISLKSSAYRVP